MSGHAQCSVHLSCTVLYYLYCGLFVGDNGLNSLPYIDVMLASFQYSPNHKWGGGGGEL